MNNYRIMLVNKLLVKHISFQRVAVPNPPCKCFPSFSTQRTFTGKKKKKKKGQKMTVEESSLDCHVATTYFQVS